MGEYMTDGFIKLDETYLQEIKSLYRRAFGRAPWEDDWSDDIQLEEYILEVSGGRNSLNYGLLRDGKLIAVSLGSIRHWWEGTNYNIEELCVDPDIQRQGIGSNFMELIEKDIKAMGLAGIFLQTDEDKPSYGFYIKNGYNLLGKHVSFYKSVKE